MVATVGAHLHVQPLSSLSNFRPPRPSGCRYQTEFYTPTNAHRRVVAGMEVLVPMPLIFLVDVRAQVKASPVLASILARSGETLSTHGIVFEPRDRAKMLWSALGRSGRRVHCFLC